MRVIINFGLHVNSRSLIGVPLAFPLAVLLSGCGSGGRGQAADAGQSLTIAVQPANQTVPLSSSATFSVVATDSDPSAYISYQWSKNGVPIPGANTASYTTPAVAPGDNQSTYKAAVSAGGILTFSNSATLTVGPRSPKPGDVRFQQVDASSTAAFAYPSGIESAAIPGTEQGLQNGVGTPLQIGGNCADGYLYDCTWRIEIEPLPSGQSGLSIDYYGGAYSSFNSDLAGGRQGLQPGLSVPGSVITSLDFEPVDDAYAVAWINSSQGAPFDMRREVVAPAAIAATAAQDAAESRVVTAVAWDANGQANLFSYGWQGDTTTVYDTDVQNVAAQDVASAATKMASEGYILTAFGGNVADGYMLIGTKVHGDTLPRSVLVDTQSNGSFTPLQQGTGYAPVAWVHYYVAGDPSGTANGKFEVYER